MTSRKFTFITIDILRGFAASTVFIYHYGLSSMLIKLFRITGLEIFSKIGASYAVPLFFLISGFCIHLSQLKQCSISGSNELKFWPYIKRRLWRIYPTYLIIFLFACAVSSIEGTHISVSDFFIHIFVFQGFSVKYFNSINLVLWTITIEMLFYLIYPIWYLMRNKLGLNQALLVAFITSGISCSIINLFFDYNHLPSRYFVLNIWGAWCFGAWLCEQLVVNHKNLFADKAWWFTGILLFVLFYILQPYSWFKIASYNISIVLWGWFLVPFFLLENAIQVSKNRIVIVITKIVVAIGLSSYSLYMLHEPLMMLRNSLLKNVTSNGLRIFLGGIWFFLTFIVAWLSYQLFEKPFLSYRSSRK